MLTNVFKDPESFRVFAALPSCLGLTLKHFDTNLDLERYKRHIADQHFVRSAPAAPPLAQSQVC